MALATALTGALLAGSAACSSAGVGAGGETGATSAASSVASSGPNAADSSGHAAARPSAPPAGAPSWGKDRPACEVELPGTVEARTFSPGGGRAVWPQGGPSTQGWLAVTEYSPEFAGVAMWNLGTNERREVYRFASAQSSAMGAFDGRYLVSKEVQSSANWNVFTLRAHDVTTGQTWTLDTNPPVDATGHVPATPLESFGVRDGRAWWIRATAPNVTAVKLADLADRQVRQLAEGDYVTAHFYRDGLLVEHFSPAKYGVRDLLDATGAVQPLPARLARLNGNRWVSVGPRGDLAWLDEDWTRLSYAGPDDDQGRLAIQTTIKGKFQNLPSIGESGLVVPTMEPGTYYLDTTTGTYAKVLGGNFGTLLGHRVVTLPAAEVAKARTTSGYGELRILDLPAGSLGGCPAR